MIIITLTIKEADEGMSVQIESDKQIATAAEYVLETSVLNVISMVAQPHDWRSVQIGQKQAS